MNVPNASINPSAPVIFQPLQEEDITLRIRVKAELADIKSELDRCDPQDPLIATLKRWYQQFSKSLQHPDIKQVIERFVPVLENIFRDPLNEQVPFHPKLFEENAPDIIKFMISMMKSENSLFYSKQIDQAEFQIKLNRINEIDTQRKIEKAARRNQEEEAATERFQNFRARIIAEEVEKNNRPAVIFKETMEDLGKIRKKITKKRQEIQTKDKKLTKAAKILRKEAKQLREERKVLEADLKRVKIAIDSVERANIELQISINKVEEQIRKSKSNWILDVALIAASVVVTWGISQCLQNVAMQFTNGGAGLTFTF